MSKQVGINLVVVNRKLTNINSKLAEIDNEIQKMKEPFEKMQKEAWYGGSRSKVWYTNMGNYITNTASKNLQIRQINEDLYSYAKQAASTFGN